VLPQPDPLPEGLPAPVDDGAARHLSGRALPPLALPATDGTTVRLDAVSRGRWVLFIYPQTGKPGADIPIGWDQIPGARGCSQEACGFRDNLTALQEHGVETILALSTDRTENQRALAQRFHLPYLLLSDPARALGQALDLPTFPAFGTTLYKRLTMIMRGTTIEHVFYPVFPPDRHASEVMAWLSVHPEPA
jgi:peroxiredoxin